MSDATVLLTAVEQGDSKAAAELLELVYDELRHLASAEAMRHILIDRARRKQAERHGGRFVRVEIDEFELAAPSPDEELLAVHEVLDAFSVQYPVQAELVKLRYFAGMTNEEASQVLGISLSTLNNYWNFSRAWLFKQIRGK